MIKTKGFKMSCLPLMLICLFCAKVVQAPEIVWCDIKLTDAHKKEIVYRMYNEYKREFPSVKDLSPPEAMKRMKTGRIIFVDLRKPKEMKTSMLPGAVTKKDFLTHLPQYENFTVVAYCTISYRSGKFVVDMGKKGISAYNLKGGILAWVLEGGKVYNSHGETKQVHVYADEWNYLPEGYEPVLFGFFEKYF